MRTTILTTVCLNDIETKQTLCTQINGEMFFPASEKGNADSVIPKDMKRTEVVHKIESVS